MSQFGYHFYFEVDRDVLTFPITPGELKIKVDSKNQVITLIGEGDINVLKSPKLVEIEFEARFPMRQYPYAREFKDFKSYYDVFKDLMENRKSFRFIVVRTTPRGDRTWDTDFLVALESFDIEESADEGDDVIVKFKLKQYKTYGVKVLKTPNNKSTTTSTSNTPRSDNNKASKTQTYTVQQGDCLWNIAKKYYGSGALYTKIYEANKTAIENDAKKHGKQSSSNGNWIWAGLKLTIPPK